MKVNRHLHAAKPVIVILLLGAILMAGARGVAWAAPSGQGTVPPQWPTAVPPSDPLPSSDTTRTNVDQSGGTATESSGSGTASVSIPAGALGGPGTLEIRPATVSEQKTAGAGTTLLVQIEINMFDYLGKKMVAPTFAAPITVCFTPTAAQLALVGNDLSKLKVQTFNSSTNAWEDLPNRRVVNGQVCGDVTHLTLFALAARTADVVTVLEVTGAEAPAWWPGALLGLAAIGIAFLLRARLAARK